MTYVDLTDVVPAPERHSGYLVDLTSIQFEESGDTSWVHALTVGEHKHPLWGLMKFPIERIQRFASNVNNNVRGIDLAIDYSHHNSEEAAGWIRKADPRDNGLWLFVEWTKKAAQRIRDKEFRYFSAEFVDEWKSETETFKDVILGGGLTNRPFLKDLLPVNLSELYEKGKEKEDESMELKELLEALDLSEDASEEDAVKAIKLLQEPPEPKEKEPVSKTDAELIKLAEESPVVKALVDEVTALQTARSLDEATRLVENWSDRSQEKFALPPAVTDKLTEILISAPQTLTEGLTEVVDHILKNGLVSFQESGTQRRVPGSDNGDDSAKAEFTTRVKKLQEENEGMSFGDAYEQVSQDVKLFNRYRAETMAGVVSDDSDTEEVDE